MSLVKDRRSLGTGGSEAPVCVAYRQKHGGAHISERYISVLEITDVDSVVSLPMWTHRLNPAKPGGERKDCMEMQRGAPDLQTQANKMLLQINKHQL